MEQGPYPISGHNTALCANPRYIPKVHIQPALQTVEIGSCWRSACLPAYVCVCALVVAAVFLLFFGLTMPRFVVLLLCYCSCCCCCCFVFSRSLFCSFFAYSLVYLFGLCFALGLFLFIRLFAFFRPTAFLQFLFF